jgi:uncharacterized protein YmfQ (DUF2313 family)
MVEKVFSKLMSAFAKELEFLEDNIILLLKEAIPGLAVDLLEDWERDLGFPDPCTPLSQTLEQRQRNVHAKYTGQYGQNPQFYIDYANSLGSTIQIVESGGYGQPFRTGDATTPDKTRVGNRLYSMQSLHTWVVKISPTDPNKSMIICTFNRLKHAHTEIIFQDL